MEKVTFNFDVQPYTQPARIAVFKDCNSITITNTGTAVAVVDNITLYPGTPGTSLGDSVTIGGNLGEILSRQSLRLSFPVPAAGQQISIIQKYYSKN